MRQTLGFELSRQHFSLPPLKRRNPLSATLHSHPALAGCYTLQAEGNRFNGLLSAATQLRGQRLIYF
jgi:hypothetical protein